MANSKRSRISTPSPAQDRYLGSLRGDHARFSRVLSLIGRDAQRLRDDPAAVLPLFREAIDYIVNFQNVHHHPREDRMFARMAARLPSLAPLAAKLSREHVATERSGRNLLRLLQDASVQRSGWVERALLARALEEFAARMRGHMRLEEELMYAPALGKLSRSDWKAMSSEADVLDPLGAPDVSRYRLLSRYVRSGSALSRVSMESAPLEELARLARSGLGPRLRTLRGLAAMSGRQCREAGELYWRAWRAMPLVPILRPLESLRAARVSARSFAEWASACNRAWRSVGVDQPLVTRSPDQRAPPGRDAALPSERGRRGA